MRVLAARVPPRLPCKIARASVSPFFIQPRPDMTTANRSIIDPSRLDRIEFSNDEIARYSRHLIMPEVTLEGQKRLKAASVLCIGAGGLGSPILLYLAAAGVGRIGVVDSD